MKATKYAVILLALIFALCGVFVGCGSGTGEAGPMAPASSAQKAEIEKALGELHGWDFVFPILNAGQDDYSYAGSLCCGVADGAAAVLTPSEQGSKEYDIGGLDFGVPSPAFLDIVKDGMAYPIEMALKDGVIDEAQLKAMLEVHKAEAAKFLTAEKKYAVSDDTLIVVLTGAESLKFSDAYSGEYGAFGFVTAEEQEDRVLQDAKRKAEELKASGLEGEALEAKLDDLGIDYKRVFSMKLPEKSVKAVYEAAEWFASLDWVESAEPLSFELSGFGK